MDTTVMNELIGVLETLTPDQIRDLHDQVRNDNTNWNAYQSHVTNHLAAAATPFCGCIYGWATALRLGWSIDPATHRWAARALYQIKEHTPLELYLFLNPAEEVTREVLAIIESYRGDHADQP